MGSGATLTGRKTQSELDPGACSVLEPSKPQMGGAVPSGTTLVFERSFAVGFCPSIQMYSARYAMTDLRSVGGDVGAGAATRPVAGPPLFQEPISLS
jgi:hypothetical protein